MKKVGGGVAIGGGGFGGPPPKKIENCKLMCNRLRTLRIERYALGYLSVIVGDKSCCWSLKFFVKRKPRVEFALLIILSMWASHSRVSLRQTPRYDVDETLASDSNVSPLRVYWSTSFIDFGLDTLRTKHFERLKHITHRSAHNVL